MTAKEFREILDRFRKALVDASHWKLDNVGLEGTESQWLVDLDRVWRDLNYVCVLMEPDSVGVPP